MKKYYKLVTNIVFNGQVGYREYHVEEALKNGQDLLCTTQDRPGEFMTIPNFLIKKRLLRKKVVRDRTGAEVELYYYWWKSDQDIAKEKVERNKKQLKLI